MNRLVPVISALAMLAVFIPAQVRADFPPAWDNDANGSLDDNEFYTFSYDAFDHNGDGLLDNNEWYDYSAAWFDPYDINHGDFDYYDYDDSGFLNVEEYSYLIDDTRLYRYWDNNNDGRLTSEEFGRAGSDRFGLDNQSLAERYE